MKLLPSLYKILLIVVIAGGVANAQWVLKNNGLSSSWGNGYAIDAVDSSFAVCSYSDGIFNTTDGGNNWTNISISISVDIAMDLCIIDKSNFVAVTDKGKIYITTNSGTSWDVSFSDSTKTSFMNYVEMFGNDGIAMGDAAAGDAPAIFLKTTDGGKNWISVNDTSLIGVGSGDLWRRIDFVNPEVGYFYTSFSIPQKIRKTTHSGESWNVTNFKGYAAALKFYNENYGIANNSEHDIYRTTDGGENWETFYIDTVGWAGDFEFIPGDPSKIWFCANNLSFSSDSGRTLERV